MFLRYEILRGGGGEVRLDYAIYESESCLSGTEFCVLLWRPQALPRFTTRQYKAPGVDQILAELIQAEGNIF
jgi:hypothetical protein